MITRVIALHHAGHGVPAIARATGLTTDEVWRVLHSAGIARPAHLTRAAAKGENLSDPKRADKLLRSF